MGSDSNSNHNLVYFEAANSKSLSREIYEPKNKGPGLLDLQVAVPEDILQRERDRFSQIFEKYSTQDDSVVNDVVDIYTGKVIEDNGHLKSLKDQEGGVSGLGLVTDLWVEDFNQLPLPQRRKIVERLRKIQMEHQLLGKFSDFVETRNSSFQTLESPTKKQRRNSFESSSPIKADNLNKLFPKLEHENSDSHLESPTKLGDNIFTYFDDHAENSDSHSDFSESSDAYDSDLASFIVFDCFPNSKVLLCAFLNCGYTSELRNDYERHLLSSHCDELFQLGYPVSCKNPDVPRKAILDLCILRLNKQFPLAMDMPAEPFRCQINLKHGPCKKLFLNQANLLAHQKEVHECSSRRQVLQCPVLGCDYITEDSYDVLLLHARTHVNAGLKRTFPSIEGKIPQLSASQAFATPQVDTVAETLKISDQQDDSDLQDLSDNLNESDEYSTDEFNARSIKAVPSAGRAFDFSLRQDSPTLEELFSD